MVNGYYDGLKAIELLSRLLNHLKEDWMEANLKHLKRKAILCLAFETRLF